MANGLRRPAAGLIAHTDRGSQYTSLRYTDRLDELGIAPSVGSQGDAYDNAMAEAWVATFKSELVDGRRFPSFEHAEHETLHWIGFYNDERLHEELGDLPPAEYEAVEYQDRQQPNPGCQIKEPLRNPGRFSLGCWAEQGLRLTAPQATSTIRRPGGERSGVEAL